MRSNIPLNEIFWENVCKYKELDACWEWIRARDNYGYGEINRHGKHLRAPRVAWELTYGSIPKGMCVLHRCDNPPCVRPSHLYLGTHKDNTKDMVIRGRSKLQLGPHAVKFGQGAHRAKLTQKQVDDIREQRKHGESLKKLAKEFHVSFGTISKISLRTRWKR